jgi:membrane-associated protease RseP (regulator of RpoE activity)
MNDEPATRGNARDGTGQPDGGPPLSSPDSNRDGVGWPGLVTGWSPRPKFRDRVWLHVLLLVLTMGTMTLSGVDWYRSFTHEYLNGDPVGPITGQLLLQGLWYSGSILAILGCHELGHYFACRYYDVDASLPFFLPMPLLFTGTLGAFIRIREPIPTKRMLFDIGIAGPIAGFVIAVPVLFIGLGLSRFDPIVPTSQIPPDVIFYSMGEPLLFKLAAWIMRGPAPEGYTLSLHPAGFAAWFGLLATALNLLPIGQLDGGHISYAALGRRSSRVTVGTLTAAVALCFLSSSWIIWTVLMIAMLLRFGWHHPPTFDEHEPLDRTRIILAIVALAMFLICFTPVPLELVDLTAR